MQHVCKRYLFPCIVIVANIVSDNDGRASVTKKKNKCIWPVGEMLRKLYSRCLADSGRVVNITYLLFQKLR